MMNLTCAVFLVLFISENVLGFQSTDPSEVTSLHNEVREKIRQGQVPGQPRGINVENLQWDQALAAKAQELAKKCNHGHELVQDPRWQFVGQNLFGTSEGSTANWRQAVNGWYEEYKQYQFSSNPSHLAGHYTQLVWANTKFVGCAFAQCSGMNSYVCNYGPAGNAMNEYPYQTA